MDTFVLNLNLSDNVPLIVVGSIRSTLLHLKVGIKPSKDLGHKLTLHQLELPSAEVVNRRRPKDPHKVEVYPTDPKDSPGRRTLLHPLIRATDLAESEGSPFNVAVYAQANSVSFNQSSADSKLPCAPHASLPVFVLRMK